MSLTIARLVGPVQAVNGSVRNNVHVVPAGQVHMVKSLIVRNARGDGQVITYDLGIIPAGETYDSNRHPWLRGVTLATSDPRTIDFSLMVLNAGDTVYITPNASGLYYEAHGMVSA